MIKSERLTRRVCHIIVTVTYLSDSRCTAARWTHVAEYRLERPEPWMSEGHAILVHLLPMLYLFQLHS